MRRDPTILWFRIMKIDILNYRFNQFHKFFLILAHRCLSNHHLSNTPKPSKKRNQLIILDHVMWALRSHVPKYIPILKRASPHDVFLNYVILLVIMFLFPNKKKEKLFGFSFEI